MSKRGGRATARPKAAAQVSQTPKAKLLLQDPTAKSAICEDLDHQHEPQDSDALWPRYPRPIKDSGAYADPPKRAPKNSLDVELQRSASLKLLTAQLGVPSCPDHFLGILPQ